MEHYFNRLDLRKEGHFKINKDLIGNVERIIEDLPIRVVCNGRLTKDVQINVIQENSKIIFSPLNDTPGLESIEYQGINKIDQEKYKVKYISTNGKIPHVQIEEKKTGIDLRFFGVQ